MKLFGIPLRIDPTFLVVVALLGATGGRDLAGVVLWIGVVLVSIVIHELGHALTARAFGLSPRIDLHGMGGTTSWRGGARLGWWRHVLVTLAGPFAGFAVGAGVWGLAQWQAPAIAQQPLLSLFVQDALWVNVGWGALNLLPILPLDGGNVVATVLEAVVGPRSRRIAHGVSAVAAFGIAAFALWHRELWIALLAGWIAFSNFRGIRARPEGSPLLAAWHHGVDAVRRGRTAEVREAAAAARSAGGDGEGLARTLDAFAARLDGSHDGTALAGVPDALREEPVVRALLHLSAGEHGPAAAILRGAFDEDPQRVADPLLASALVRAGRADEALEIARRGPAARVAPAYLAVLQEEGYDAGAFEASAEAGRLLFERHPGPSIPYNVACALARLGRTDEALTWLERAGRLGGLKAEDLDADPDLEPLRGRPEFEALRRTA